MDPVPVPAQPAARGRFGIRRPRLFAIGGALLAAVLLANHLEYDRHQERIRASAASGVVVRSETGAGGHASIGIAEDAAAFSFAQLGRWDFSPSGGPPCPPEVQAHDGQPRTLVGFMYPLAQGERISSFCLLRSTQTCCYGPKPQFSQYLLVETREPVAFERLRPVVVTGRFRVDPQPGQGYIYRFEDATVAAVGEEAGPVDPAAYARDHHLGLWDWAWLGALAGQERRAAPADLLARDGAAMVVAGAVIQVDATQPPQLVLGLHPPPGRPDGRRPTMFDALTVLPAPGSALPQPWEQRVAWQGTLRVVADPAAWDHLGIVRLEGATPCTARLPEVDNGPMIGWIVEAVLVGAFLLATLGRRP